MTEELLVMINKSPDRYQLAIFLEPYLSMVKSRALYSLANALRYEKDYNEAVRLVVEEAMKDYRLDRVLQLLKIKMSRGC